MKNDLRSKQTLVIPRKIFDLDFEKIIKYIQSGIGISLIEDIYNNEEDRELLSTIYSLIIGNLIFAGHNVKIMMKDSDLDSLTKDIIEKLEKFVAKDKLTIVKN